MDGNALKERILKMKERVDTVEAELNKQIDSLSLLEQKWIDIDGYAEHMRKAENNIVHFNVCGKKFSTRMETLLNIKDTFFYKLVISKQINLKDEIFISRCPKWFSIILDYLRKKNLDLKRFNKKQLIKLKFEAEYYELNDIVNQIGDDYLEIQFVNLEMSAPYMYSNIVVGTNNLEDITDRNLAKGGIIANTPGKIHIELNKEWLIDGLEVGGYTGNSSYWSYDNGYGATIELSTDNKKWNNVGTIPYGYGSVIARVSFEKQKAKWIRFTYSSYIGIGFLELKQAK